MRAPDIDAVVASVRRRQKPVTPVERAQAAAFKAANRADRRAAQARAKALKDLEKAEKVLKSTAGDVRNSVADAGHSVASNLSSSAHHLGDRLSSVSLSSVSLPSVSLPDVPSVHVPSVQLPSVQLPDAVTSRAHALAARVPDVSVSGGRLVVRKKPSRKDRLIEAVTPVLKAAPVVIAAAAVGFVVMKTLKKYGPGFIGDVKEGAAEREAQLRTDLGLDVWDEDPNTDEDYEAVGKKPKKK